MQHWWNLDLHLAGVIAGELRNYSAKSHAYPSDMTQEQWLKKLDSIATRLEAYNKKFNTDAYDEQLEIVRMGQEAMHELADIFPALWD